MKDKSVRNYVTENLMAVNPHQATMRSANKRKMCWRCQKDKPTQNGHIDLRHGLHKFVCADCIAAKKAKNEVPTVQSTN